MDIALRRPTAAIGCLLRTDSGIERCSVSCFGPAARIQDQHERASALTWANSTQQKHGILIADPFPNPFPAPGREAGLF
jgi:hypothetical protein